MPELNRPPVIFKFLVSTVVPVRSSYIVKSVPAEPVTITELLGVALKNISVVPFKNSMFGNSTGFVEFL
jgi:hypothetical protein